MVVILWGGNIIIEMKKNMLMQVMREEGLEQVTGLSCGSGDNQMVSLSLSEGIYPNSQCNFEIVTTL